jgi:hypothetical protein
MTNEGIKPKQTDVPPILILVDGKWFIRVIDGPTIIDAPVGQWFITQVFEKIVMPELRK